MRPWLGVIAALAAGCSSGEDRVADAGSVVIDAGPTILTVVVAPGQLVYSDPGGINCGMCASPAEQCTLPPDGYAGVCHLMVEPGTHVTLHLQSITKSYTPSQVTCSTGNANIPVSAVPGDPLACELAVPYTMGVEVTSS